MRLLGGSEITPGAAYFKANGCFECHQVGGTGGTEGPALDTVGIHTDAAGIAAYIANPSAINPKAEMPDFARLSPDEIKAMADFLAQMKGGRP